MTVTTVEPRRKELPFAEFVIIISLMTSLIALSIDAMLPALADIDSDLALQNSNDRQLVVSMIFFGLALGQLFFGPLSDSIGRKRATYYGYVIYIGGSLLSAFAFNFPMMLAGRVLQGIGVSAPRAITLAIVRDRYEGRMMAKVMSFVMTVFILVPMIAPILGQTILLFVGWRAIFACFILIALVSVIWFAVRMPETLPSENRAPFSLNRIIGATVVIVKNRIALGYTIAIGLVSGAFLGYLNSSQQIFQDQYSLGELFPIVFSGIAIPIGLASLSNTRLVMRFGMRLLVNWALRAIIVLAVIALGIAMFTEGNPPLWFVLTYLVLSFFCVGILFGNLNTLAMEPLGRLAGIGAAIVGSLSTLVQMVLGTFIGQNYNNTIFPLVISFAILSGLSILVIMWIESDKST